MSLETVDEAFRGTSPLRRFYHRLPSLSFVLFGTLSIILSRLHSLPISLSSALPPFLLPSDIRDTVNYKEVMKQYSLGPNGGIVTSLNLFATRFDQVTQSNANPLNLFRLSTRYQSHWCCAGTVVLEFREHQSPELHLLSYNGNIMTWQHVDCHGFTLVKVGCQFYS